MKAVAVVGGGISGLAAAYYLTRTAEAGVRVDVLEATPRWGGLLRTESEGGFLLEAAADSISASKPEALQLVRDLGLEEELLPIRPAGRRAYLRLAGGYVPLSPVSLLSPPIDRSAFSEGTLLTPAGRARLEQEPAVAPGNGASETVAQFTRRRLGEEFLERAVGPLMAGVYGADAGDLSAAAVLPALVQLEVESGCVSTARRHGVPDRSSFFAFRTGVGRLIDILRDQMEGRARLRSGVPVVGLSRNSGRWQLDCGGRDLVEADAVVLATPAGTAGGLLSGVQPDLAAALREIRYSPARIAALGFEKLPLPSDCAGFLLPRSQPGPLMACSWSSNKFQGRAPDGVHLVRCFLRPDSALQEQEAVASALIAQLHDEFGFAVPPVLQRIYTWPAGLPRYSPGHLERVARLIDRAADCRGLELVGNYLDGVGISDCIRHAREAARRVLENGEEATSFQPFVPGVHL